MSTAFYCKPVTNFRTGYSKEGVFYFVLLLLYWSRNDFYHLLIFFFGAKELRTSIDIPLNSNDKCSEWNRTSGRRKSPNVPNSYTNTYTMRALGPLGMSHRAEKFVKGKKKCIDLQYASWPLAVIVFAWFSVNAKIKYYFCYLTQSLIREFDNRELYIGYSS